MAREWYVRVGDKQYGPIPSAQLRQWATERRITAESQVREKDGGQWVAAGEVQGLFAPVVPPSSAPQPLPVSEQETSGLDFLNSSESGTGRRVVASRPVLSVCSQKKKQPIKLYISGGAVVFVLGVAAIWYFGGTASAAEKRFAAQLIAFLDYCEGTARLLDDGAFGAADERAEKVKELYAAIPEPPNGIQWARSALEKSSKLRVFMQVDLPMKITLSIGFIKDGPDWADKAKKESKEGAAEARKRILEIRNLVPPGCLP